MCRRNSTRWVSNFCSLLSLFCSLTTSFLCPPRLLSQVVLGSPSCPIPSISAPAAGAPGAEQLSLEFLSQHSVVGAEFKHWRFLFAKAAYVTPVLSLALFLLCLILLIPSSCMPYGYILETAVTVRSLAGSGGGVGAKRGMSRSRGLGQHPQCFYLPPAPTR